MYILRDLENKGVVMLTWLKAVYLFLVDSAQSYLYPEQPVQEENTTALYDDHEIITDRIIHAMAVNNHRLSDTERLEVLFNSYDEYTESMLEVRDALRGLSEFPKKEYSLRRVKICNFYRDRAGDIHASVSYARGKLLDAMLAVVVEHKKLSKVENKSGWMNYVLRRSETVMINIDYLTNEMVKPRLGE